MMMNAVQVTTIKPLTCVRNTSQVHCFPSKSSVLPINWDPLSRTYMSLRAKPSSGLRYVSILKSQRPLHVCLAGGSGMMDNNEDPWQAFEKDMEKFKAQSIEDLLHQQIQKGDYGNGGKGPKPPHGGGGGGGGGAFGGSDDGRRFAGMSNETIQIVLATIGFIFVYICVIDGLELAKLFRDCIKYLITGKQSVRLKRALYKWTRLYKNMKEKKEACKHQLENASTWTNDGYCRDFFRKYLKPNSTE